MKSRFLACPILTMTAVLGAGALHAQVVPPTPTTPPSPEVMPQREGTERVTVTGCLKQERDVPGMTSHPAERAGLGEGFIITNARLTAIAAPTANTPPEQPTVQSSRTASATMYRVAGLDNEKLQSLLNQQVEVSGRLESAPQPTDMASTVEPERHAEPEAETQVGHTNDLQQIRATAIRVVSATCTSGTS